MTRWFALALVGLALVPRPALAQDVPGAVHWGKWGVLAAGLGFVMAAGASHRDADDTYNELEQRCADIPMNCDLGPDGEYLDPESERLYQEAIDQDDTARRWLVAAEVALIGTAVLFIWDFLRDDPPEDDTIPFTPFVDGAGGRVGAQFRF